MPTSMAAAIQLEAGRLELLRTRAWVVMGFATAIASALFTAMMPMLALAGIVVGVGVAAWFSVAALALGRARWRSLHGVGGLLVELTAPATYYGLAVMLDADSALGFFGPILLLCGALIVSVFRLRPSLTFIIGLANAAQYWVWTVAVMFPALTQTSPYATVANASATALALTACGGVAAWVSHGVRQAMGGVARTLRAQELFGKYRLEEEIAAGGMGVVWRATYCPEGGFHRPAAVKVIHPHLASEPQRIEQFRREAELCARLVHESIVQVFDFGRVDETYFLAMELVDGPPLSRVLRAAVERDVPAPPAAVGAIGRALLDALAFAHEGAVDEHGRQLCVIHRDMAPQNVLLTSTGAVKVADFGIARALYDRTVEATHTVIGHLDHMAPEQAEGQPLDARCDLFAVGVMLWELLAARWLFRRNGEAATLRALLQEPVPSLSSVRPELHGLDAFFQRALARDRSQRFSSAAEMREALTRALPDGGREAVRQLLAFAEAMPPRTTALDTAPTRVEPKPTVTS